MIKRLVIIFLLLVVFQSVKSIDYTGFRMGIKLPYSYNFGYYTRITDRWGAYGGVQAVTFPFSGAPIEFLKFWGGKEALVNILEEPFSIGVGFDLGAHYYFGADNRRYYVAASLQWMDLLKRDIRDEVIEEAFGVELDEYPIGPILEELSKKPLTLNTHFLNIGAAFGIRFLLPYNPDWEIAMEFEIQKTIASHHFLFSDYRYITPVEKETSIALKKLMREAGWFPTLNLIFIKKFN